MSNEPLVPTEALQYALTRTTDFALVNQGRTHAERVHAITMLFEGIGLTPDGFLAVVEWCEDQGLEESGDIMMGLIMGLFVNEFNHG